MYHKECGGGIVPYTGTSNVGDLYRCVKCHETFTKCESMVSCAGGENDAVNSPAHYTEGGMETIEVLKAKLTTEQFYGFCIGNAIKYMTRAPHKGKLLEDLKKAQWYLTCIIARHCESCWKQTPDCKCKQ